MAKSNGFKIDLVKVLDASAKIIDAAEARVPVGDLAREVVKSKIAGFEELEPVDQDVLVKASIIASENYDVRAGRNGGAGRKEWFKGGSSSVEPQGVGARIAKRLREERGLERDEASRIANAYLEALIGGETGKLSDEDMIKKFK